MSLLVEVLTPRPLSLRGERETQVGVAARSQRAPYAWHDR
jgi:hypothetical protein